jgi:hypothetical protein
MRRFVYVYIESKTRQHTVHNNIAGGLSELRCNFKHVTDFIKVSVAKHEANGYIAVVMQMMQPTTNAIVLRGVPLIGRENWGGGLNFVVWGYRPTSSN